MSLSPPWSTPEAFRSAEEFAAFIGNTERILKLWPASAAFFIPGGVVPNRGDIFREPLLAATLGELVKAEKLGSGNRSAKLRAVRDYFYQGSLARRIAAFSEKNGGLIAYNDLSSFHAETDTPKSVTYRTYEILKPGFWTQGPVMLQTLNILEGYNLRGHGAQSAEYLHTTIEAVKLAFADRDVYYGDPKFSKIPEDVLLSKQYAAVRRRSIDAAHASLEHRPGNPGIPAVSPSSGGGFKGGDQDTTSSMSWTGRETYLGDPKRRLAAFGHCGRYRRATQHASAEFRA